MRNIFLSDELFLFNKSYTKGFITFLKKEKQNNLFVSNNILRKKELMSILFCEEIQLLNYSDQDCEKIIAIENNIVANNVKYKNFNSMINNRIQDRTSVVERNTRETKIKIYCNLDGNGNGDISTGIGFFDHMLDQIARHSNIDLKITVKGDLNVDEHHTVEDTGIALGECLLKAMDSKKGINRYGFFLPMDETIAKCAIDLGGRTFLNYKCKFKREFIGDFPTELFLEFFRGLASGMNANIYLRAKGENEHHKAEALFKVFAKSLNSALKYDSRNLGNLPTTKGVL